MAQSLHYRPVERIEDKQAPPTLQMRVSFTDRLTGRRMSLVVSDPKQLDAIAKRANP